MSTNETPILSTYGLACGSTELGKTRNKFLGVSAGCIYAIIVFFRFVIYMFQGGENHCLENSEFYMNFFLDTINAFLKVYFIGLIPIIALRKLLIQESVRRNTPACFLDELHILMYKKRTYVIPLIYTISSIIIGWTYFGLIGTSYRRTRSMFLYPGTEDFWCPSHRKDNCKGLLPMISEHYLIVLVHNIILGTWYGYDFLIRKRYILSFNITEPRYPFSLLKELLIIWNRKCNILVWNTLTIALHFSLMYWFIKLLIWNTIYEWLPNLIFLHNTAIYYWMRASWFDVQLFNRTVINSIFTIMCWLVIEHLIEHFFTRIHFTIGVYMDPHAILINGLHSYQQPYYQQLAFLELWHIAKFDQYRRSAIYADFNRKRPFECVKHNYPTSAWTEISRSCMDIILGLAYSVQDEIKKHHARKLLLKKKYEKFRNMEREALKEKERKIVGHDLEVKMTVETMTRDRDYLEMKLLEWFHPITGNYPYFVKKFYSFTAVPLLKRSIERRTKNLFKDLYITICAIQALTALTIKSLNEDKHGIVQNDIANVFESMLDCLMSLERYSNEPPLDEWDVGDPSTFTYSRVLSDPLIVINVLKDALFDLRKAFYPHMDYVKLSSIHYNRLNKLFSKGL